MNIPLGQWSGSDATNELRATIEKYQNENEKQTRAMLNLTKVIAVLTFVMLVGLGIQIDIAIYPLNLGN